MIARPLFISVVIASLTTFSAGTAQAADAEGGMTRAEVKAAVAEARARGELMPAGERLFAYAAGRGSLARDHVKAIVLQASADGELMPAGDRPMAFAPARSLRARAEVKDEVLQARANSALVPAGERLATFEPASHPARTYRSHGEMTASIRR